MVRIVGITHGPFNEFVSAVAVGRVVTCHGEPTPLRTGGDDLASLALEFDSRIILQ
jgi:hypothetical protein